jgi:hypothetical protein
MPAWTAARFWSCRFVLEEGENPSFLPMFEQAFQKMSEWISVASPLFVHGLPSGLFPFAKNFHCSPAGPTRDTVCPSFQSSQIDGYRTPGKCLVIRCFEGPLSFEPGPGQLRGING